MLATNQRLRAWRVAHFARQSDAAKAAKIGQGPWSEIENGKRRPTLDQAFRIEDLTRETGEEIPARDWVKTRKMRRITRKAA